MKRRHQKTGDHEQRCRDHIAQTTSQEETEGFEDCSHRTGIALDRLVSFMPYIIVKRD